MPKDFAADHDPDKVTSILAKVLPKMSEAGKAYIVDLGLPEALQSAIDAAKEQAR